MNLYTPVKRTSFYAGILFLSVTLTNCSNDDDNPPEDFDFSEQFQDIDEIPDLVIDEPTFDEPDLGGVEQSAETESLLADFNDGDDLSSETQAKIDALDDFAAGLSSEVLTEAESLDDARLEELMALDSFDGDLASLVTALENAPAEVKQLLPAIRFSDDFNMSASAVNRNGLGVDIKEAVSQAIEEEGPCYDAAKAAYDTALAPATTKYEEQQAQIEAFQTTQEAAAITRSESRTTNVSEAAGTYRTEILERAKSILSIANDYEASQPELAQTVKLLALVYVIQGSQALAEWDTAATNLIQVRRATEEATIAALTTDYLGNVLASYEAINGQATTILNAAYRNCHNQGGGN